VSSSQSTITLATDQLTQLLAAHHNG
jgi:hypothetical protein